MRKLVVSTFTTLDGVMDEGMETWHFPYFDDGMGAVARELLFAADTILCGRQTYESFAGAWPSEEGEFADRINSLPKLVVSTTLEEPLEWNNSKLLEGDVVEEVRKLKEQPGENILIYGSGRLADTLRQANLVDEHRLWIHPYVWGKGTRLLAGGTEAKIGKLADVTQTPSGVAILTYVAD
jgi:dihydrofolate reductase